MQMPSTYPKRFLFTSFLAKILSIGEPRITAEAQVSHR